MLTGFIGITPAGAGKTPRIALIGQLKKDHPRRCGENWQCAYFSAVLAGSPPQVRGKRFVCDRGISHERITPAGAGKTTQPARDCPSCQDHPRRCGENLPDFKFSGDVKGSPPQVRGKHSVRVLLQQRVGITPAGAGKTNGRI